MFTTRVKATLLALALLSVQSLAHAADNDNYMHWPYVPPQVPGSGANYEQLYDGWYRYHANSVSYHKFRAHSIVTSTVARKTATGSVA